MDIYSRNQRSAVMRAVKGKGNRSTELRAVSLMRNLGLRGWRRHFRIKGRPDFAFPKLRLAIFIDGCFWHGCPEHFNWPKTNLPFWRKKILRNMERDSEIDSELRRCGWTVKRFWEHEFTQTKLSATARKLGHLYQRAHIRRS